MIALALSIVLSVTFGHVMKWAERCRAHLLWVGAWNYLAATLACLVVTLSGAPPTRAIPFTLAIGLGAGACYLVSLLFYSAAIGAVGVGLATATNRLSVALPVGVAVMVWREHLDRWQTLGLLVVVLALPLLGRGQGDARRGGLALLAGVLVPLFVVTGLGQLAARVYSGGAPAANTFLYLTCLFAGAAACALIAVRLRPTVPRGRDIGLGLLLGAVNVGSNLCLLAALRELPSAVVFAVSSSAGVVLAAVSGVLVWDERLNRGAVGGVALAALAVVLLVQ